MKTLALALFSTFVLASAARAECVPVDVGMIGSTWKVKDLKTGLVYGNPSPSRTWTFEGARDAAKDPSICPSLAMENEQRNREEAARLADETTRRNEEIRRQWQTEHDQEAAQKAQATQCKVVSEEEALAARQAVVDKRLRLVRALGANVVALMTDDMVMEAKLPPKPKASAK